MKLVISYDNVFHSRSKSVLFTFHIPSFSLIEEDISTHKCTWNIDSIDETVHTIKPCFVLYRELELPSKMQNDITKNRYEMFENRYRSLFFLHTCLVSLAISKSEVLSSIYWSCIEKHQRHISVTFVILQLEIKSVWKETPCEAYMYHVSDNTLSSSWISSTETQRHVCKPWRCQSRRDNKRFASVLFPCRKAQNELIPKKITTTPQNLATSI
jgi:hypothetical protein